MSLIYPVVLLNELANVFLFTFLIYYYSSWRKNKLRTEVVMLGNLSVLFFCYAD